MAPRRRSLAAFVIASLLVSAFVAPVAAQDVYSERTLELSQQLECPVCQGQTIAESQSDLAVTMRAIVEEKVQAGESDAAILQYFADRYGDSVLVDPPKTGVGIGLWWIPPLVVLLGAGVVVTYVREGTARPVAPATAVSSSDDDELETIAREVLADRPGAGRNSQA